MHSDKKSQGSKQKTGNKIPNLNVNGIVHTCNFPLILKLHYDEKLYHM